MQSMDRGTFKASSILNQAGKVNEMNHFSGIPGGFFCYTRQFTDYPNLQHKQLVITLCRMNLTNSWMVSVDFYCSTAKRLLAMLKSCCAGAVEFIQTCIFLYMHCASYLEISEAGVLWTRGKSLIKWTTKSFWNVFKWAELCPRLFIDVVSSPFNGTVLRHCSSVWGCR